MSRLPPKASRLPPATSTSPPISRLPLPAPGPGTPGTTPTAYTLSQPALYTLRDPVILLSHLMHNGTFKEVLDMLKERYWYANASRKSILDNLQPCEVDRSDDEGRLLLVSALEIVGENAANKSLWYFCLLLRKGANPLAWGEDGRRVDSVLKTKSLYTGPMKRVKEQWEEAIKCIQEKREYEIPTAIKTVMHELYDELSKVPEDQMITDSDDFFADDAGSFQPPALKRPGAVLPSHDQRIAKKAKE